MVATNQLTEQLANRNSEEFRSLFDAAVRDGWTPEQLGYLVDRPHRYAPEYRKFRAAALLVNRQGKADLDPDEVLLLELCPDETLYDWAAKNVIVAPELTIPDYIAVDYAGDDWEPRTIMADDSDGSRIKLSPTRQATEDGRTCVLFSVEVYP